MVGVCRDLLFLQLPKTSPSASSPVHYICHPPVWDGLLLSSVSPCPLVYGGPVYKPTSSTDQRGADKFHLMLEEWDKGRTSGGEGCLWPPLTLTYNISKGGESRRKFQIGELPHASWALTSLVPFAFNQVCRWTVKASFYGRKGLSEHPNKHLSQCRDKSQWLHPYRKI